MSISSLRKRLNKVKEKMNPAPMIVLVGLAADPDAGRIEMTAKRYYDEGYGLPQVVDGGNIKDLDLILAKIAQQAEENIERSRTDEEEV